jgi:hypothetical protein
MSTSRIFGFLALAIAWLSIAWGYSGRGQWWGVLAAALPVVIFGVAAARDARHQSSGPLGVAGRRAGWPQAAWQQPAFQESACLAALFCISAIGILAGADAFAMILGATAGLAAWDLFSTNRPTAAAGAGTARGSTARSYERRRGLVLALALAAGLLLAVAGKLLPLRIPFVVVVLLVLVDAYSLDRLARARRG